MSGPNSASDDFNKGLLVIFQTSKATGNATFGNFGTVCDDHFSEKAGELACKQLGLGDFISFERFDKSFLKG